MGIEISLLEMPKFVSAELFLPTKMVRWNKVQLVKFSTLFVATFCAFLVIQNVYFNQYESTEYGEHLLRFINSTGQFDLAKDLKDHLYKSNWTIEQLDHVLQLDYSTFNNSIDLDIDKRRSDGKLTNFKISDFVNITQVRYGAQSCDMNITAVVFIITKPNDFKMRSLIRKTWGTNFAAKKSTIRLYFAFGLNQLPKSEIDQLVREESLRFEDIIQWNFEDGYWRLTIKSMAILRWASLHCPRVPIVIKTDADCILNYDQLVKFNDQILSRIDNQYYIYGNLWQGARVIRDTSNKFFTSFNDYPRKWYPDYIGGPWYLAGRNLPLNLYRTAVLHSMPALMWEDAYVTGIVAQKLIDSQFPLERKHIEGLKYDVNQEKIDYQLYTQSVILTQAVNESNLEQVWARIKDGESYANSHKSELTQNSRTNFNCESVPFCDILFID